MVATNESNLDLPKPFELMSEVQEIAERNTTDNYENAALKQRFSLWSTLGLTFSLTGTPLTMGAYMTFSIAAGGSPFYFWSFIVVMVFNILVCTSLSEIAAVLPHSGGQIFWAARLAPKYGRTVSYWTGALTATAWFFLLAAGYLFVAQLILGLAIIHRPTYEPTTWHYYLLYLALAFFSLFMNTFGIKLMPYLAKIMVVVINCSAVFLLIVLMVRSSPKPAARDVFVKVVNETGWSSTGWVFLLAFLPAATSITGFDGAAHLADEVPNPSRHIPQVMMGGALLSALGGLVMVPVYLFSIVKPANLLNPVGGQAILQLLLDSLDSMALTTISAILYIMCIAFACATIGTGTSRVIWSFARQSPVPLSAWLSTIHTSLNVPSNATIFTAVLACLLGLLIFGPVSVLTSIVGSGIVCLYISYLIPIFCMLCSPRSQLPARRYFNLGRGGVVVNIISILWLVLLVICLMMPVTLPVTGPTMNYTVAVLGATGVIFGFNWLVFGHRFYVAPTQAVYDAQFHGHRE